MSAVFICSMTFGGDNEPRFTVLIGGKYYVVGAHLLSVLRSGTTPEELDLEPDEHEEENAEIEAEEARRGSHLTRGAHLL